MLKLDMKNMQARNMEELAQNLKDIADSIKDGYNSGVMKPGCIWKVEGEEEKEEKEKVFRISFTGDVWIKSKSREEAIEYFESIELLSDEALELGGEVSEMYTVEEWK